jgi:hypothetical protein
MHGDVKYQVGGSEKQLVREIDTINIENTNTQLHLNSAHYSIAEKIRRRLVLLKNGMRHLSSTEPIHQVNLVRGNLNIHSS